MFPQDQFTDQPERFLVAEIVREKAILLTREEVPYAVAVLVDSFEEATDLIKIRATIYVEREGQKGILIGKGAETIKKIGTQARKEIEAILGTHIFHRAERNRAAELAPEFYGRSPTGLAPPAGAARRFARRIAVVLTGGYSAFEGAIPSERILRYKWLRSSPSECAAFVMFQRLSSSLRSTNSRS